MRDRRKKKPLHVRIPHLIIQSAAYFMLAFGGLAMLHHAAVPKARAIQACR